MLSCAFAYQACRAEVARLTQHLAQSEEGGDVVRQTKHPRPFGGSGFHFHTRRGGNDGSCAGKQALENSGAKTFSPPKQQRFRAKPHLRLDSRGGGTATVRAAIRSTSTAKTNSSVVRDPTPCSRGQRVLAARKQARRRFCHKTPILSAMASVHCT